VIRRAPPFSTLLWRVQDGSAPSLLGHHPDLPLLDSEAIVRKHPLVPRKLARFCLILALLATVGGHWFVFQSFAWATMLVDNLQTSSLSEAVSRTFDGNHPCRMCKHISEQRKTEKQSEAPAPQIRKLEFVLQPVTFVFSAPELFWLQTADVNHLTSISSAPLLPPPRTPPV
jgi:hypothetical protein